MDKHERFTITVSFIVCEGVKDKVLDEIKEVRHFIEKSLDHASDVKTYVHHDPIEDKPQQIEEQKEIQNG